jgi:hypothetical protein
MFPDNADLQVFPPKTIYEQRNVFDQSKIIINVDMMSQLYMNGERGSIEQNVYNKCKVKQL